MGKDEGEGTYQNKRNSLIKNEIDVIRSEF